MLAACLALARLYILGMYPHVRAAVDNGAVLLEWDKRKGKPTAPMLKVCPSLSLSVPCGLDLFFSISLFSSLAVSVESSR